MDIYTSYSLQLLCRCVACVTTLLQIERDMSFAGSFKSMIGGDTICDHYNPATKSYCKRLKVICAEHAKDPKVTQPTCILAKYITVQCTLQNIAVPQYILQCAMLPGNCIAMQNSVQCDAMH